ncbi:hypothetical protein RclHR1_33840001 [Rhizophagus clarus]|nr:hypothetical protein RclHR1_33840001 [Rhizophagus clarus]
MAQNFSPDLHTLITKLRFNPDNFYTIFQSAFNSAYEKFQMHISQHPVRPLFRTSRIFDPLYVKIGIQVGDTSRNDIYRYLVIIELNNPSDKLLQEWAIYCESVNEIVEENIDLNLYWVGKKRILPILLNIALDIIWLPISSCSVERSFSMYNNLLNSDWQNLFCELLKQLNMLYFNGEKGESG